MLLWILHERALGGHHILGSAVLGESDEEQGRDQVQVSTAPLLLRISYRFSTLYILTSFHICISSIHTAPTISCNSNYKPLKAPVGGGDDDDTDDEATPSLPTSTSGVRDKNRGQARRRTSDDDGAAEHAERDHSSFALLRSYFFR